VLSATNTVMKTLVFKHFRVALARWIYLRQVPNDQGISPCRSPRIFECAKCGHQHSITAGTVFHKTHTGLRKWFIAAYRIGHDKRGVSSRPEGVLSLTGIQLVLAMTAASISSVAFITPSDS
jgi:hypothetical protein